MPNDPTTATTAATASATASHAPVTMMPPPASVPAPAADAPRVLVIGAGSRGHAYGLATEATGLARVVAVAEPRAAVRAAFGARFVWGPGPGQTAGEGQEFAGWQEWVAWETARRAAGGAPGEGIEIAFVCVLDDMHLPVIRALARLGGVHVMCEKPLAQTLADCLDMYRDVRAGWRDTGKETVFGIGHVLRYAPHNVLLRRLVREERVVGDIMSVEHTEPIGWWHFAHSYVRGNWRNDKTSAPSLLAKSCHDLDFLLWMMCSPATPGEEPPHLPATITSTGSLRYFRKVRKPVAAGAATNCLKCPIESSCKYSAKHIYLEKHLDQGDLTWPVHIVVPDIEEIYNASGKQAAVDKVLEALAEDYGDDVPREQVGKRNWYGRCVWDSDNNTLDDQTVTISWNDDPLPREGNGAPDAEAGGLNGRGAKTALFHMVAFTDAVCARRGVIYGSDGEVSYDSENIRVLNFYTGETKSYHVPAPPDAGHGGGDDALALNMINAVLAVRKGDMTVQQAQWSHLGCDLDEMLRSHAAVFAAEEARREGTVVDWEKWWERAVVGRLAR